MPGKYSEVGLVFAIFDSNAFPDLRAILHDETKYPQPFQFNPGRFLNSDGQLNKDIQHPEVACFGFGRR